MSAELGTVCRLVKGGLDPQRHAEDTFAHYSIPAFDSGRGPVIETGENIHSQKTPIPIGVVLVSKLNPRIPRVWHVNDDQPYERICSTEFVALQPDPTILEPAYLSFALREALQAGFIKGNTAAATKSRERAKPTDFLRLRVKVPSLSEQLRIVDLLSRAENIVRMRREASRLAKEIIPALFLDMFGDPGRNPKGWHAKCLAELVTFVSGGTPSKSREDYWQGQLPWISPKDMKVAEIVDAEDHISDDVPIQTSIKLIPPGAVLIVIRGMILVHTVPVAITRVPATINQDMKALLAHGSVNEDYLMWLLRVSQGWLLTLVTTAAHGTRKIDTPRLQALPIPVPPKALQESFVQRVRTLLAVTASQSSAEERAERTFQSLLAGVFSESRAT